MLFCKLMFHIDKVQDYSCGYRAYQVGYLRKLYKYYEGHIIRSKNFECMLEILVKLGKLGVKVGEYPLILEYGQKQGTSKMNVCKIIVGYFRLAYTVRKPKINKVEVYE